MQRGLLFALGIILLLTTQACDPCRKLAKSRDFALKDSAAYCYYERKQFESAAMMFEELMGVYGPGPQAEKTLYYLATSKYKSGELITASFTYNEFLERYPGSERIEEVHYQLAQCYYRMSNPWRLDQRDTYQAIDRLQLFIELYPDGERATFASEQLSSLRGRLATKAFKQADLFLNIGHYKAGVTAFKGFIEDYPDSEYREEAQFKMFKSAWYFADNSIDAKKEERFNHSKELYVKFVDRFPESKYIRSAERLYDNTDSRMRTLTRAEKRKERREQRRIERSEQKVIDSEKGPKDKDPNLTQEKKKEPKRKKKDKDKNKRKDNDNDNDNE